MKRQMSLLICLALFPLTLAGQTPGPAAAPNGNASGLPRPAAVEGRLEPDTGADRCPRPAHHSRRGALLPTAGASRGRHGSTFGDAPLPFPPESRR